MTAGDQRSARRFGTAPSARINTLGARLVLQESVPTPELEPTHIQAFGRPTETALRLWNSGSGDMTWTLSENASWLWFSSDTEDTQLSGSMAGEGDAALIVHTTPEGLAEGGYQAVIEVILPGGATMEFVWVDPGSFEMGSPEDELGRQPDESPLHEVEITGGFFLGRHEITQRQWASVMQTAPWVGEDFVQEHPDRLATHISWDDMQSLIQRLNVAAGEVIYRLPTEAEWEFAARAGSQARYSFGDDPGGLDQVAW